jgi:hypothetical protein
MPVMLLVTMAWLKHARNRFGEPETPSVFARCPARRQLAVYVPYDVAKHGGEANEFVTVIRADRRERRVRATLFASSSRQRMS